jgi:hypothetical protein
MPDVDMERRAATAEELGEVFVDLSESAVTQLLEIRGFPQDDFDADFPIHEAEVPVAAPPRKRKTTPDYGRAGAQPKKGKQKGAVRQAKTVKQPKVSTKAKKKGKGNILETLTFPQHLYEMYTDDDSEDAITADDTDDEYNDFTTKKDYIKCLKRKVKFAGAHSKKENKNYKVLVFGYQPDDETRRVHSLIRKKALDLSEISVPSQHMKYDGFSLQGDLDSDVEESGNYNLGITETGQPSSASLQPSAGIQRVVATGDAYDGVAESTVETDAALVNENFGDEQLLINSEGQSYLPM